MIRALCLLATLCVFSSASRSEETMSQADIESRLQALEEELSRYRQQLENSEEHKTEIEDSLQRNEESINQLIKKIEHIEHDLGQNRERISALEGRQSELTQRKSEQQELIEQQVRAAYEMGNQEYLKVLLNQEDPHDLTRMLTYYDYFNEARASQINQYNEVLTELEQVSADLNLTVQALASNHQALQDERSALASAQHQKKLSLQALRHQIRSTGTEISKLEGDRDHLEKLLTHIVNQLTEMPERFDGTPFASMRGQLVLPVVGNVLATFGKKRNAGKLRWEGLLIEADEGQPVYAVHHGRVVFSDWLRGFGLLLIISHGEGYMSLYGHNQALYLDTGDWVSAGDLIATVGDSGGQTKPGLYFEIRIKGKPSDPQQWCVARSQRAA